MRRYIFFTLSILLTISAYAQQRTIIGDIKPQNSREERILRHYNRDYNFAKRGYFGVVELGAQGGDEGSYNIEVVNGFRFNPWVALGVGTGINLVNGENVAIPVFGYLRTDILDKRVTPYFTLSAGADLYTFSRFDEKNIEARAEITCGVSVRFRSGKQICFGIGNGGNLEFSSYKFHIGLVW